MSKTCNKCKLPLPESAFSPGSGRKHLRSRCKLCTAQDAAAYRVAHPEKARASKLAYAAKHPEAVRRWANHSAWRKMGLVPRVVELLMARRTRCEICGDEVSLIPDHDHNRVGYLRGFLCSPCNLGLGQFKDDPARLRAAADYLERSPEELEWCG